MAMGKIRQRKTKIKAAQYVGGPQEKTIWHRWFYLRHKKKRALWLAFVRGTRAAKHDRDRCPYPIFSLRRNVWQFGRVFFYYFLKQALDLERARDPRRFHFGQFIREHTSTRHLRTGTI